MEFFDKLKKGLDKSVATVSVKSREVLETTQLRSQVRALQEEKQKALEELGSIAYTLFGQGKLEEGTERIRVKCEKLAALDQRILEKEEEIRQVHLKAQEALGGGPKEALATCDCGVPIYEGTKFCGGCGKRVEEVLNRNGPGTEKTGRACPQCGATLGTDVRFCGVCGFRVGEGTS